MVRFCTAQSVNCLYKFTAWLVNIKKSKIVIVEFYNVQKQKKWKSFIFLNKNVSQRSDSMFGMKFVIRLCGLV